MTSDDDWRLLRGQEEYLSGRTLRWKRWWSYREGWDHDHCAFCWVDICDAADEGSRSEAFVTEDDYHWICADCYTDFADRFSWVIDQEGSDGPPGSPSGQP
jgi:hypothetical protein